MGEKGDSVKQEVLDADRAHGRSERLSLLQADNQPVEGSVLACVSLRH